MGKVFAEEIRVLSGGAARSFVEPAAAAFPGHTVKLEYQPMGRLVQTMAGAGAPVPGGRHPGVVADFLKFLTGKEAQSRLAPAGYSAPR